MFSLYQYHVLKNEEEAEMFKRFELALYQSCGKKTKNKRFSEYLSSPYEFILAVFDSLLLSIISYILQ